MSTKRKLTFVETKLLLKEVGWGGWSGVDAVARISRLVESGSTNNSFIRKHLRFLYCHRGPLPMEQSNYV
jgi:hypothetical protein